MGARVRTANDLRLVRAISLRGLEIKKKKKKRKKNEDALASTGIRFILLFVVLDDPESVLPGKGGASNYADKGPSRRLAETRSHPERNLRPRGAAAAAGGG